MLGIGVSDNKLYSKKKTYRTLRDYEENVLCNWAFAINPIEAKKAKTKDELIRVIKGKGVRTNG